MDSQVQQLESLLNIGEDGVRAVGIWGMGGIGKTTIAQFIFDKFSSQFEGICFLENVREESKRRGLVQLKNELFSELFHGKYVNTRSPFIRKQLQRIKVLIVLDDVDAYKQIEELAGRGDGFGAESRVLITSRDKSVFQDRVCEIYEVKALPSNEALRLFSLSAFKQNHPTKDKLRLSERAVNYAQGNPLAVKVLGQHLHDKSKQEWRSALNKLSKMPNREVHGVLRISYDGLDSQEQRVFLYIACVLEGDDSSYVEEILRECDFYISIALKVLADKSLIVIINGKVGMHDLLREMGREIVRQESIEEPGKRSMLWDHKDVCDVLRNNTGTAYVEAISLDLSQIKSLPIHPAAFVNMNRIKLLQIKRDHDWFFDPFLDERLKSDSGKVYCHQQLESLPNDSRYLRWNFYPWKLLPPNFDPKKLVELDMSGSKVTRLWTQVQDLPKLKVVTLRYCKQLIEMPDFSMAPNLKVIDFRGCKGLREVSPSISLLRKVELLDLSCCEKIECVPSTRDATSLRILDLFGCKMLNKFPQVSENITSLNLSMTAISEIPPSVGTLTRLEFLDLYECARLDNLPSEIFRLQSLCGLHISGPYANILCIENVFCLHSLRKLTLDGETIVSIPESIKQLSCLQDLNISCCPDLYSLPGLPSSLLCLRANDCVSLRKIPDALIPSPKRYDILSDDHMEEFYFINCPSLDQNQYRYISTQARQRIIYLAYETAELVKRLNRRGDSIRRQFLIALNGDEIPKWITRHCVESSVNVSLPPNWRNNFLGFALCVVLEFSEDDRSNLDPLLIRWDCRFKSNCGGSVCLSTDFYSDYHLVTEEVGADFVFVYYDSNFHTRVNEGGDGKYNYNEVSLEVCIEDRGHRRPTKIKLIKCGVELLYDNDKAKSSQTTSFTEKEKEPHAAEEINLELALSYPQNCQNGGNESPMNNKRKLSVDQSCAANILSSSCDDNLPYQDLSLPWMKKNKRHLENPSPGLCNRNLEILDLLR